MKFITSDVDAVKVKKYAFAMHSWDVEYIVAAFKMVMADQGFVPKHYQDSLVLHKKESEQVIRLFNGSEVDNLFGDVEGEEAEDVNEPDTVEEEAAVVGEKRSREISVELGAHVEQLPAKGVEAPVELEEHGEQAQGEQAQGEQAQGVETEVVQEERGPTKQYTRKTKKQRLASQPDQLGDLTTSLLKAKRLVQENRIVRIAQEDTVAGSSVSAVDLVNRYAIELRNEKVARLRKYMCCYHLELTFERMKREAGGKLTRKRFMTLAGIQDNMYDTVRDMQTIGGKLVLIIGYLGGDVSFLATEEILSIPLNNEHPARLILQQVDIEQQPGCPQASYPCGNFSGTSSLKS
ncbi:hypothetical protein EDC96DRAFT_590258 [Choanephora cucurbitarum]|nr:hypothetical protein EDC96DRAFT_590258 [Choanephora cucurbitarum]